MGRRRLDSGIEDRKALRAYLALLMVVGVSGLHIHIHEHFGACSAFFFFVRLEGSLY